MKKKLFSFILTSLLLPISSYATCDTSILTKKPIGLDLIEEKDNRIVNLKCLPQTTEPQDENCAWNSSIVIKDDNPICIYYQIDTTKEFTDFDKNKIISKYLKENNSKSLSVEYNKQIQNFTDVNKELNKKIIEEKNDETLDSMLEYLPSVDTKSLFDKLQNPLSVNMNSSIDTFGRSKVWEECSDEKHKILPTFGFDNMLDELVSAIDKVQDEIKEQSNQMVDELYSTMYDLTSDEAVIQYIIYSISNLTAMASCSIQSKIPTDLTSASANASLTKNIVKEKSEDNLGTADETTQGEKETAKGCFFAIESECIIPNDIISGAGVGSRDKEETLSDEHVDTQSDAAKESMVETAYNECLKTEPEKIAKYIYNFLNQSLKGVDAELYAIKKCNDEDFKKKIGEGAIYDKSKEEQQLMDTILEKVLNGSINYLNNKQQAVVGYINRKQDSLYDLSNAKTKEKPKLSLEFEVLKKKYEKTTNENEELELLLNKNISGNNFSYSIKKNLYKTVKSVKKIYGFKQSIIQYIDLILKKLEDTSISDYEKKLILEYSEKEIKDYNLYLNTLLDYVIQNTKTNNTYSCVSYDDNNKCLKFGMKSTIFNNLDEVNNMFFNKIILDRNPDLLKMNIDNYKTFTNYINVLNPLENKGELINNYKVYMDFLLYDFLRQSIIELKKLDVDYDYRNMTQFSIMKFIDLNNNLFNIVRNTK